MATVLGAAVIMCSVPLSALAGDTLPYIDGSAKGSNQPYQHGYRAEDLLDWSPETDPYASLLKAQIPLQQRNDAFAATQANPNLDSKAQYFTLAGDYGNAFFDSYPYTNQFSQYNFNFWQYADYYGSWHGMPTEDVPESLYNAAGERDGTSNWQQRNFEFGMMNLPNPGYTNAAHKNGVLSIGCIFQPRAYQHYDILLKKDADGNFPYAQKLIEMCKYYGFDGWFFNMEGRSISAANKALLGDFFTQMRNAGLYIQWYTASSSFSGSTAGFLTSATPGNTDGAKPRANSVFLDYGWSTSSLQSSANTATSYGLDAFKAIFGGIEAGGNRWSNNFDRFMSGGKMVASIASLGTDFVHHGLDEDLGTGNKMLREQDEYQWMAFDRERMWWTGPTMDPTVANTGSVSRSDVGVSSTSFKGVSQYITERSVINGDTFVTNFNTGHGLEYEVNGSVSNTNEWSNINIQDILPTWQWWFQTKGKLSADFDYGTKYKKDLKDGTASQFAYNLVGAYNGGSSLAVYGKIDAENFMHLYKTDLDVKNGSKMSVTFKKTSQDSATMQLGLIFKDDPGTVVKVDIPNSAAKSDNWVTSAVDLSAYAGKKIAAFGLVFNGAADTYQINIGQIKYTFGSAMKPAAPTNFKVAKAYDTGEMVVSWDMAGYDTVKQYNVYAVENGKEIFLGGTYDSSFYIKNIYDTTDNVTLELKAVSVDGTESDSANVSYDYSKAVKDVKVTATDGKLNVMWTGGQADVVVKKSCSTDSTAYAASGDGSATVIVPTGKDADGARYTMAITKYGVTTTYDGRMNDCYSVPYTGGIPNLMFQNPLSKDWWKLHYWVTTTDGAEQAEKVYTRGSGGDWADFSLLPSNTDKVKVVLEDYSGNMSEPVYCYVLSVSVTPSTATVQGTKTQAFTATVKNDFDNKGITWTVEGNKSAATTISKDGLLTVGADETATALTVRATANADNATSGTASVTVLPATIINPNSGTYYQGDTKQLVVEYLGTPLPLSDYNWLIVTGLGLVAPVVGTAVDDHGLLTIARNQTTGKLKIRATNKINSSSYFEGTFTIGLELALQQATSGTAYKGTSIAINPVYKGINSDPAGYTWTVVSNTSGVSLSAGTTITNGVLTIDPSEQANSLTITAVSKSDAVLTSSMTLSIANAVSLTRSPSSTVRKGQQVTFTAKYRGVTDDSSNYNWLVESNTTGTTLSAGTTIANGVLTTALDEPAGSVKVTATRKDTGEAVSITFSLSAPSISFTNTQTSVMQGQIYKTSISINGTVMNASDFTWTVAGNDKAGTTIDNGMLTVAMDESLKNLTITAGYKQLPTVTVSKTITVKALPASLVNCVSINKLLAVGPTDAYGSNYSAVDGDEYTEWYVYADSGYIALDLNQNYVINRWRVVNSEGYEMQKLALEVLKDPNATAAQLADKTYLADANNWTEVQFVDNSSKALDVDKTLDTPVYGRYFRLRMDQSTNGYVDIYDFQLYGRLPADMTALSTAISSCDSLVETAYTANSWSSFKVKLDAAKTMAAQMTATQDEVTAAAADLQSAKDALVLRGDTILLNELINVCNQLAETTYTPNTWSAFAPQLTAAKTVLNDPNAVQSDVDAAYQALISARLALQERAQTGVLVQTIAAAEALDTTNNRPATVAALKTALDAAKTVRDNLNATQQEVNEANTNLLTAMINLLDIADNKKLVDLISSADTLDLSKYTADTAATLQTALSKAKQVSGNKDATEQDVADAYRDLANALAHLTVKVNTSELANTIALADTVLNAIGNYAPPSVKNLKQATNAAKAVLAKEDATQDEINKAAKDLAAVLQQVRVKADKAQLNETVSKANAVDASRYTVESVKLMKAALASADSLLKNDDAEQAEVDNAKVQLAKAINGLKLLSDEPTQTTTTTEQKPVSTGDSQQFMPFVLSLAGAIILLMLKKGNKHDEKIEE